MKKMFLTTEGNSSTVSVRLTSGFHKPRAVVSGGFSPRARRRSSLSLHQSAVSEEYNIKGGGMGPQNESHTSSWEVNCRVGLRDNDACWSGREEVGSNALI